MTKLINIKKLTPADGDYTYIGRGSVFGNPFKIPEHGNREEVVAKYKVYFEEKIQNPSFKKSVLSLKDKTIGCFCAPEKCHGDVVIAWLDAQCPRDTDGDGNCGRPACPICSKQQTK